MDGKICEVCNSLIKIDRRTGRGKRFCSMTCYNIWRRDPININVVCRKTIVINCKLCNKEFRSNVKKLRKFCSRKCFHKNHKNDKEMHERIRKTLLGPDKTITEADATKKMSERMRSFVRRTVHSRSKNVVLELEYTPQELREHLEKQWQEGMSWENYGRRRGCWNIDHIRPLNTFDVNSTPNVVNALSNLRPLWMHENIRRPKDGSDMIESLDELTRLTEEMGLYEHQNKKDKD